MKYCAPTSWPFVDGLGHVTDITIRYKYDDNFKSAYNENMTINGGLNDELNRLYPGVMAIGMVLVFGSSGAVPQDTLRKAQ